MLLTLLKASLILSVTIDLLISAWVLRKSEEPTALPFALSRISCSGWAAFYGFDAFSSVIGEKILFAQIRLVFVAFASPTWYLWVRRFTQPSTPLGRVESAFVWLYPLVHLPFIFTMPHHSLFMHDFTLTSTLGLEILKYKIGPVQQLFILWGNLLQVGTFALLFNLILVSSHSFDRRRAGLILGVTMVTVIPNLLFLVGISPIPGYNLTPHLLAFTGVCCFWILYRYRALDLLPFARRTVFATLADGLVVFDHRSRLVDFNPSAGATLGLDSVRDFGRSPAEVFPWWGKHIESLLDASSEASSVIEVKRQTGLSPGFYEVMHRPFFGESGQSAGSILILRDVTHRHLADEALRLSENRYRTLLEGAPFPVLVTDLTSQTIIFANRRTLEWAGLPAEQVLKQPVAKFYGDPEQREAIIRELTATGTIDQREVVLVRSHGRPATVLMNVTLIEFEGKSAAYVSLTDITERKRTEESLRKSELERHELLVAEEEKKRIGRDLHDGLGQVLSGTALACRSLEQKLTERGITDLPELPLIIRRLGDAVQGARILSHGLNPVSFSGTGLWEAMHEILEQTRSIWNIDCRIAPAEPIDFPNGHAALQLFRIAQEAVHNAVRHGHPRRLTLSLLLEGNHGRLEIVDDGRGFEAAAVSGSRGRGTEIMRFRASQIGGELVCTSSPGAGTTVVCRFPVEPVERVGGRR